MHKACSMNLHVAFLHVFSKSCPSSLSQTRKPCRSTQTPRSGARNPNRSFLTGDSDGDSDDDGKFLFPPRLRPGSRGSSNPSLKRKRGPKSPSRSSRHGSRPGSRPGSRFDNLKKSASGAALDSDSEESGYGETYYTMHASSFENRLDESEVFEQPTFATLRSPPMRSPQMGLENHFSDAESAVSYLSTGAFGAVNPEDLRDADTQTPGHTSTQTPGMWGKNKPKTTQTQTASNTSLHSIGNQTRRLSSSRADLLRNILFEVKGLKQQRGIDTSSYNGSEDDTRSMASENTIKKETLETVLHDVRTLREADATGTAATQTIHEEGTQTSMKLFPEGDPVRNARLEKFKNLMDEMKDMKGSRAATPSARSQSRASTTTPVPRSRHRDTPLRFASTSEMPMQNGFQSPQDSLNATAPAMMMQAPPMQPQFMPGRRVVTQDDLNSISQRLERLQSYVPPRRPSPPPPAPPQYVVPVYAVPPSRPRRPPADDAYLSDESEYGEAPPPRRRRRGLEDALAEASHSALQLKRLSKRMKDSLRDDMRYDFM